MCSSTRGPAMAPSLVTWPTSTRAKPARLGQPDQLERRGAHLADVPGALSMASSHMVWMESITTMAASALGLQRGGDVAQVDGGGEFQRRVGEAEPAGAQAHLLDRFLAGDVEHAPAGAGERGGGLQQQGGLADARIAAEQHRRAGHQPAAEHPVELGDAGGGARRRGGVAGERRRSRAFSPRPASRAGEGGVGGFLGDGVPLAAGLAAPGPFRRDGAAGLADEAGDRARHVSATGRRALMQPSVGKMLSGPRWLRFRGAAAACPAPGPPRIGPGQKTQSLHC